MASKNPFVYLIELFSKKIQREIEEETADVRRKQIELRQRNLENIYQSERNAEAYREFRAKLANLSEKQEKLEKNKEGVSVFDRIIRAIKSIKLGFKASEAAAEGAAAGPGIGAFLASKTQAFIEKRKNEAEYIEKVAKKQKEYIKEDLKAYGEQLGKLVDEVNKDRDDYREEILSQLPKWAQEDPWIAQAPTIRILERFQAQRHWRMMEARKEQKAN